MSGAAGVPAAPRHERPAWPRRWARFAVAAAIVALLTPLFLRFGGVLLVTNDPLPERADAAIVLNGSYLGVEARLSEAVDLLRAGRVDNVMLSVGAVSYYGEWVPNLVRRFVAGEYGGAVAQRVVLCEGVADSTEEELAYLRRCLQSTSWRSVVVVTSDYHTRRTKMIMRRALRGETPVQRFTVRGVTDGSFAARGWWRERRYAKTWLLESAKLASSLASGLLPGAAAPSTGR